MRAYKFRSTQGIEFTLDILLNHRLYCADWRNLNDPMEGMFAYSATKNNPFIKKVVKGISNAKTKYRVCSLSSSFQSHLLWSHYAGGFDGLAIEVDLPEHNQNIKPLEYRGVFAFLNMDEVKNEDDAARKILLSKYNEWEYEKEIRILHNKDFFELDSPVKRVIVGHRMNPALRETIRIICDNQQIEMCKIGIGDEGLDADRMEPIDPTRFNRFRRTLQNSGMN